MKKITRYIVECDKSRFLNTEGGLEIYSPVFETFNTLNDAKKELTSHRAERSNCKPRILKITMEKVK